MLARHDSMAFALTDALPAQTVTASVGVDEDVAHARLVNVKAVFVGPFGRPQELEIRLDGIHDPVDAPSAVVGPGQGCEEMDVTDRSFVLPLREVMPTRRRATREPDVEVSKSLT